MKSRTPSGLARSTCDSLSSRPSGRNATSIASGGIEHRAVHLPSTRHHQSTPPAGYAFRDVRDRQQRSATVGCHNGQQAALGVTSQPIQEIVRVRRVAHLERREKIEEPAEPRVFRTSLPRPRFPGPTE